MNYQELIERAKQGRSVNSLAKIWGVPQPTLHKWLTGSVVPDFDVAEKIISDAGIEPLEGLRTLAQQVRINKAAKFKLQSGFVQAELLAIGAGANIVAILSILC